MDDQQRKALEQLFSHTSKPTVPQREAAAKALGLPLRSVQTWFSDRRTKAKADKRIEELQTRAALDNARQIPIHESMTLPLHPPKTHRTQSEASYASLARSLAAAAACMPPSDSGYESSLPPSPVFHLNMGFPMCSPTNMSFTTSASMVRADSQYSSYSSVNTPGEIVENSDYPFFPDHSSYMPTAFPSTNTVIYENTEAHPTEIATVRPTLQRTWTAPESQARPIPRRTISSPYSENTPPNDTGRVRRRPKLSPLGVGMARSKSCLGYEQSEYPYSARRATAPSEFSCPITPVRRIASSTVVSALPTMRSFSTTSSELTDQADQACPRSPSTQNYVYSTTHLPLSPISPDHAHVFEPQSKTINTSFDLQHLPLAENSFTPPPTPLSTLNACAENILAGGYEDTWTSEFSKFSGLDLMSNDLTLADVFNDQDFPMASF